ncbi:MAG TPA: hypothetical protein VGW75_14705 [Solirubrobacteraceae bacterium]|nr:hypothetical protein [Solirubrobacteraceae bacterium]
MRRAESAAAPRRAPLAARGPRRAAAVAAAALAAGCGTLAALAALTARAPHRVAPVAALAAAALATALATALAAGCGTPSADLFVVDRDGSLPDARLTLRVGDGGTVRCDGGEERPIASGDLLDARQLAEDLAPLLDRRVRLRPKRGSLLRYRVTGGEGEVRFADNSPGQPRVFGELIRFTRKIATTACGKAR